MARDKGLEAYTVDEFFSNPTVSGPGWYEAILAAHLVEHLPFETAIEVLRSYLPCLRPDGRVLLITPQERGYDSDPTHVAFTDFEVLRRLCAELGLEVEREWSFPFPRWAGKPFIYNEFHVLARKSS